MTITIADGRGALWQWDTGRRVKITDGVGVKQYTTKIDVSAAAWTWTLAQTARPSSRTSCCKIGTR